MNALKRISVRDIWTPPVSQNAPFLPSGSDIIDLFAIKIRMYKNDTIYNYAIAIGINPRTLTNCVQAYTGITSTEFRNKLLFYDAEWYLLHTVSPIKDIAAKMGYKNSDSFYSFFVRRSGIPPSRYRAAKQHVEVQITYDITVK